MTLSGGMLLLSLHFNHCSKLWQVQDISNTSVGVVHIVPVIITHTALYRRFCSDLAEVISIGTVHDCKSADVVGIINVNTVLLNGKIMIFKNL